MTNHTLSLLKLRILVLALGETHHASWWKSQFLSHVGLSFLERIYPRSTFAAAVHSAGRAARAMHDTNVGKGDVFHLFRLSRELERGIESILMEETQTLHVQYQPMLMNRAQLLDALEVLAGDSAAASSAGPVRLLAKVGEWTSVAAAAYLAAFREGNRVFPYFEVEKVS